MSSKKRNSLMIPMIIAAAFGLGMLVFAFIQDRVPKVKIDVKVEEMTQDTISTDTTTTLD